MGLADLGIIARAVLTGSVFSVLTLLILTRFEGYSRVVFVLDAFLLLVLVTGSRMVFRFWRDYFAGLPRLGARLIIIGAGDAGVMILREIRNNPDLAYQPIGFIDDDAGKSGKRIHGLPVLGGREKLNDIALTNRVDEILIAIPSLSEMEQKRLILLCEQTGKRYRIMPSLGKSVLG
jgi:UDP-GlcNAc:undecaprenyl-phosphate GlcNAc-1-phosphate transferase